MAPSTARAARAQLDSATIGRLESRPNPPAGKRALRVAQPFQLRNGRPLASDRGGSICVPLRPVIGVSRAGSHPLHPASPSIASIVSSAFPSSRLLT